MATLTLPPSEWMERLIRINSTTHESNLPVVNFLLPFLKKAGLKTKLQTVRENGKKFVNLLAYNQSLDANNLLALNTHLDTVESGDRKLWTQTGSDPWALTRKGDRLYGLGAADVKLDFLCKIVGAINARGTERPFVLVGTYGEERGLIGAMKLFEKPWITPKQALVGEPSNLELIYAHKGHLLCTVALELNVLGGAMIKVWKGKAAHSSTPHLGVNAIENALDEIARNDWTVHAFFGGIATNIVPESSEARLSAERGKESAKLVAFWLGLKKLAKELQTKRDLRFNPNQNTLSVNVARTSGNLLELSFDIRLLPNANVKKIQTQIERLVKKHGARITFLTIDPPLEGEKNGKFLKAAARQLKSFGVKPAARTKASSTEAAVYGQHGAEAIVFGPGVSIGNVHKPNEHNLLSQLEIATRFYTGMLKAPLREY